jgi:hypothetical protein
MNTSRAWAVGLLALLVLFSQAAAQETVLYQPQGVPGQFTLVPDGALAGTGAAAGAPLFLSEGPPAAVAGTVGGQAAPSLGSLTIGFDYLRPFWSFRDFTLAVPARAGGGFPLLGDVGHVDDHFAFAPRVNYHYRFADLDFGFRASGSFLSLTGQLQRGISSTDGGVGELNASSSLTIVVANLAEVTREAYFPDLVGKDWSPRELGDLFTVLGVGTRYASITQNYTGSLTNGAGAGANMSTRYSSQSFRGIGLTGSVELYLPEGEDWLLFSNTRLSVLIGDNHKDSTLTVNVQGQPGTSADINQTNTALVPVVEYEAGVEWGVALAEKVRAGDPQPLLTVRVAVVVQYWGGVGPLSAGSTQAYRTSDLFLVGASVLVGLHR